MSETPSTLVRALRTEAAQPPHVMPGSLSFTNWTSAPAGVVEPVDSFAEFWASLDVLQPVGKRSEKTTAA